MADFAQRRTTMVDSQVRTADVTKFPIIEAMLHVPREDFLPEARREAAYLGENLFLAPGRVVLEPRTLAKLLDALDPRPGERVLVVGAAFGYGAALLARMGAMVTALEDGPARAEAARAALGRHGLAADVVEGPLHAPPPGPFDAVLVEGAVEVVPEALVAVLAPGGRIAALFAEGPLGIARLGQEAGGRINWRHLFNAGAPVLPGFARPREFVL